MLSNLDTERPDTQRLNTEQLYSQALGFRTEAIRCGRSAREDVLACACRWSKLGSCSNPINGEQL